MAIELRHKRLTECHHFSIGLTLGVKVRTSLAATHGKRGQGVLENLLKPKEF